MTLETLCSLMGQGCVHICFLWAYCGFLERDTGTIFFFFNKGFYSRLKGTIWGGEVIPYKRKNYRELRESSEMDGQKNNHSWQRHCKWEAPKPPVWNWFSECLLRDLALLQCDTSGRLKAHHYCANHLGLGFLPFPSSPGPHRSGPKSLVMSKEGGDGKE